MNTLQNPGLVAAADEHGAHFNPCAAEAARQSFIAGADWLKTQPLAERLTDNEVRQMRYAYNLALLAREHKIEDASPQSIWTDRLNLLQAIFGKELFKDIEA